MRAKELRVMGEQGLESKSAELKKELMKINSQIAIGTLPKSPGKIKEMKRTIAKIFTIKREKLLQNKNRKEQEVKQRNG